MEPPQPWNPDSEEEEEELVEVKIEPVEEEMEEEEEEEEELVEAMEEESMLTLFLQLWDHTVRQDQILSTELEANENLLTQLYLYARERYPHINLFQ